MEYVKDIRLDDSNDVIIDNGDFELTFSDQIHIEHIIRSNKGYWLETPLLGVGIIDELNSSNSRQRLKQDIRRQLVLDNFNVKEVSITGSMEIDIDAERKI